MMNHTSDCLSANQIEDLRLAAKKMHGPARRSFEAEMAEKYCEGKAWKAAKLFGWDLHTILLGLHEKCAGLICWGAQPHRSGRKRWEDQHPEEAAIVRAIAEEHAQQDPTFHSTLAYTRLTAAKAIQCLSEHGICQENLPAPSTMAQVLNRLGYRLRKVIKAKPQRKVPETDAIFENIKQAQDEA
jgi:Rhodopirellula transposase DDE domain